MGDSPAVIIYDSTGTAVSTKTTAPTGTENALVTRNIPSGVQTVIQQEITQDAFGRFRVSQPETLFDSKLLHDAAPLFWDDQLTSGASATSTYNSNQASVTMHVAASTAGTRVRQTFRRFNYQPGKSHLISMTGILGTGAAGITRRIGYFDGYNGLFFELSGTTLNVVERTFTSGSVVDVKVAQSNWNLDKLDGYGSSGLTLDTSKAQIFIIDFQWLGVGRVRYGVYIGSSIVYVHQTLHANTSTLVYLGTPNLPLRYEISNSGAGVASDLIHICSSVVSEGGRENTGITLSSDRGTSTFTSTNNTNLFPVIAIRLGSTTLDATIDPLYITLLCSSNAAFKYALLLNPTVSGTALSFSSITNSSVQSTGATTTNATSVSGGTQILSGYMQTAGGNGFLTANIPSYLTLGSSIAGVADILVLAIAVPAATAETFLGSIAWREEI